MLFINQEIKRVGGPPRVSEKATTVCLCWSFVAAWHVLLDVIRRWEDTTAATRSRSPHERPRDESHLQRRRCWGIWMNRFFLATTNNLGMQLVYVCVRFYGTCQYMLVCVFCFFCSVSHSSSNFLMSGIRPGNIPIGSMYAIYANIWGILMVNVTIYSIHGSYGIDEGHPDSTAEICRSCRNTLL